MADLRVHTQAEHVELVIVGKVVHLALAIAAAERAERQLGLAGRAASLSWVVSVYHHHQP